FRPYKVGVNIPNAMSTPENAPKAVYENIFYYKNKKTGKVKKFKEKNYPWKDTINWQYEDMVSNLVKEGYVPPIHDLSFESAEGENIIDFIVYDQKYVFILVAYDLSKSNTKSQEKINRLAQWAMDNGLSFIGLTSTLHDESQIFSAENNVPYEFFNCDEITLKTMIRSNPGLIVLKNGNIIAKYHFNDIPTPEEFQKKFMNK
ncbi:MAG: hypothetical protein J7L95_00135, partial [Prolixibacteraceae bacterium]|nr:hypothetical protein [Prolixibacteraceae bacterium]